VPGNELWFQATVEAANGKQVIVRSNLTIYFEKGLRIFQNTVPNIKRELLLPCYLEDNVDKMGIGVYDASIALQRLNNLGYGKDPSLILIWYNPQIPTLKKFSLTPEQTKLEKKAYLKEHFDIVLTTFSRLQTRWRTKFHLEHRKLHKSYFLRVELQFQHS